MFLLHKYVIRGRHEDVLLSRMLRVPLAFFARDPASLFSFLLFPLSRTARGERVKNGAIDLSQAGAELKFKIDPITGEGRFHSLFLHGMAPRAPMIPLLFLSRERGLGEEFELLSCLSSHPLL